MMSRWITGTMRWGSWGMGMDDQAMTQMIEDVYEAGVRTFDLADIYGGYTTDEDFGRALKQSSVNREDIEIITKCGICYPTQGLRSFKLKHYDTSAHYIRQSVERALEVLHTDFLDTLLIHRPDPLMNFEEVATCFHELQSEGKVKSFGVSNFLPHQFRTLHGMFPLVCNQVEASVFHLDPFLDGTFDLCQELKVIPQIWSPLGGGGFLNPETDQEYRVNKKVQDLALKYEQSNTNVMLQFIYQHPSKPQIVLGTSKVSRIVEAQEVGTFELSKEDWFDLWTASTGHKVP